MTPKLRTKDVSRALYANFLKKSEECLNAAINSFKMKEYNASAIAAIHFCIAGCDSMCVYNPGKRSSGESHNDAVKLFKRAPPGRRPHDRLKLARTPLHSVLHRVKPEDTIQGHMKIFMRKSTNRGLSLRGFRKRGNRAGLISSGQFQIIR